MAKPASDSENEMDEDLINIFIVKDYEGAGPEAFNSVPFPRFPLAKDIVEVVGRHYDQTSLGEDWTLFTSSEKTGERNYLAGLITGEASHRGGQKFYGPAFVAKCNEACDEFTQIDPDEFAEMVEIWINSNEPDERGDALESFFGGGPVPR